MNRLILLGIFGLVLSVGCYAQAQQNSDGASAESKASAKPAAAAKEPIKKKRTRTSK